MRAWSELNLSNLQHNFRLVRRHLPGGVEVMAVVKSDAYGHGLKYIVPELDRLGVDSLAVISLEEALLARQLSTKPMLIMGYLDSREIADAIEAGFILSLYDRELVSLYERTAERVGKICRVHLKVETGLNRLGINIDDAEAILSGQHRFPHLSIEAIFSHFANSSSRPKCLEQLGQLQELLVRVQDRSQILPVHLSSSEALTVFPEGHFDSIRAGLVFYGVDEKLPGLKPTFSVKSVVMQVKDIQQGEGVSYGHLFIADKPSRIAVVAIGYAEGFTQALTDRAEVLIKGRRFKVIGKVCMNLIVVEVGDYPIKRGDEVVILGSQKSDDGKIDTITATDLANWSQLRHHELITRFGTVLPKKIINS